MPFSTPNLVANPVLLENFTTYPAAGIIRQVEGLVLPWYNRLTTTIWAGEPIIIQGAVAISKKPVLPGKVGSFYLQWVGDFLVNPALAAAIVAGDLLYWNYDLNGAEGGVTLASGVGCVATAAPTNGFQFGRAIITELTDVVVDGSSDAICATTSPLSARVRVANLPGSVTTYGTIPVFH